MTSTNTPPSSGTITDPQGDTHGRGVNLDTPAGPTVDVQLDFTNYATPNQ